MPLSEIQTRLKFLLIPDALLDSVFFWLDYQHSFFHLKIFYEVAEKPKDKEETNGCIALISDMSRQ